MIYIPNMCGICKGLTKSLSTIYDVYEQELNKEYPSDIYVYKMIINNDKVMQELEGLGINFIDNIKEVSNDSIVIIGPYGINKNDKEYLDNNNITYYDTTCTYVSKFISFINEKYLDGYEIIIIGNKEDELNKYIKELYDNVVIIDNEDDIHNLSYNLKKLIISSNNYNKDKFEYLTKLIKEEYYSDLIEVKSAFCKNVDKILESSIETQKECDLMFIINDDCLYNELSKNGKCYLFNNVYEFYKYLINNDDYLNKNIGITSSIYTPIKELYNYKYLLSFMMKYKNDYKEIYNNLKDEKDIIISSTLISGFMVYLGYFIATSKDDNKALELATSYELLKSSLLTHSDIINNVKVRNNKMTIPRSICDKYLNLKNDSNYMKDVLKYANSKAICMGDIYIFKASNHLLNNYSIRNIPKLLNEFNNISINTINKEINIIEDLFNDILNNNDVDNEKYLNNTEYILTDPFNLGYILGNKDKDDSIINVLNKIGKYYKYKLLYEDIIEELESINNTIYEEIDSLDILEDGKDILKGLMIYINMINN